MKKHFSKNIKTTVNVRFVGHLWDHDLLFVVVKVRHVIITFSQISVRNRAEVSACRELAVLLSADA